MSSRSSNSRISYKMHNVFFYKSRERMRERKKFVSYLCTVEPIFEMDFDHVALTISSLILFRHNKCKTLTIVLMLYLLARVKQNGMIRIGLNTFMLHNHQLKESRKIFDITNTKH